MQVAIIRGEVIKAEGEVGSDGEIPLTILHSKLKAIDLVCFLVYFLSVAACLNFVCYFLLFSACAYSNGQQETMRLIKSMRLAASVRLI